MSAKQPAKQAKIVPLGDRVLVMGISELEGKKTASGIIIPETVDKERPERGKVIAVGEGRRTESGTLIPPRVKAGDIVIFSKYGLDDVKEGGKHYFILKEESILAVIK